MKATVGSVVLSLISISGLGATHALAQSAAKITQPQLEQLVAPIALYPDALLTQILMSSTYPFEIFEAQRWAAQNPGLAGAALESALTQHDWDPSVKAMCGFPGVLAQMSDNLDWTKDLGDAFLAQKAEVLATVQSMRQKAMQSGSLKTTEQQRVTQDDSAIVVTSANPDVIYVPTYSPLVVYGAAWHYPTYYYPALYRAPAAGTGAVAFTAGVAWGAAMYGNCDWHHGDLSVNVNQYSSFNKNTGYNSNQTKSNKAAASNANASRGNIGSTNIQHSVDGQATWQHDPDHRQGVNYANADTARQFSPAQGANKQAHDRARGYGEAASERTPSGVDSAFSGSRNADFDRHASERGAASWGGAGRRP